MQRYDKEFKTEALKLSDEIGVKKAAEQLGLHYNTIADWRKIRKRRQEAETSVPETQLQSRNRQLEKENAELRRANEILKEALGFFAKDRRK